jgi:hypothetical protein
MFTPNSRYAKVPEAIYVDRLGRSYPYKLLRPFPPEAPTRQWHELADGERLDLVAFRFYGDPEQFWRICDGNRALRPEDLEVVARRLRIPLAVS